MSSVTLPDILSVIPAPTYIIKTDIQGYDCRALSDERLYTSQYLIPFILMEWHPDQPLCSHLVDILLAHGYSPFLEPYVEVDKNCLAALTDYVDILWLHRNSKRNWRIEADKRKASECAVNTQNNKIILYFD